MKKYILLLLFNLIIPSVIFSQAASGSDGVNIYYYETQHEAFEAAASFNSSIDTPIEITLFKDIVLDNPLVVSDNIHIRLVTGDSPVLIQRGENNLEFPLIWIRGENASLTLGKPIMRQELFIDGGYINEPPVIAKSSLVSVMGPNSKLIMYDNVTLQNNYNNGVPLITSYHKHGSGVFINSTDADKPSEFIMKGGVIKGNTNNVNNSYASGGGVLVFDDGIFTMEGGVIMNNTAQYNGGGLFVAGGGTFKKTGGIIYGSNAAAGFRNIVLEGAGSPKTYGHSVCVAVIFPVLFSYRNDTVKENDNLSFNGTPAGWGLNGEGEKWTKPYQITIYRISVIILAVLIIGIPVFLIVLNNINKKRLKKVQMEYSVPQIDYDNLNFTPREKKICELLLTDCTIKNIANTLDLTYSGTNFHIQNLYRKLEIQSRTELFVKLGTKKTVNI